MGLVAPRRPRHRPRLRAGRDGRHRRASGQDRRRQRRPAALRGRPGRRRLRAAGAARAGGPAHPPVERLHLLGPGRRTPGLAYRCDHLGRRRIGRGLRDGGAAPRRRRPLTAARPRDDQRLRARTGRPHRRTPRTGQPRRGRRGRGRRPPGRPGPRGEGTYRPAHGGRARPGAAARRGARVARDGWRTARRGWRRHGS